MEGPSFVPTFCDEARQTCPIHSLAIYSSLGRSPVGVLLQGSVRIEGVSYSDDLVCYWNWDGKSEEQSSGSHLGLVWRIQ